MHSAPAEVIPDSESLPEQPTTQPERPQDDEPRPRKARGWIIAGVSAVVLLLIILALVTRMGRKSGDHPVTQSATVAPSQTLRLKGTTEAVQARAILAPLLAGQSVPTLTIIHLTPAGTRVKQGDLLVEFDRQAQMRDFVDKQADYGKLVDQVAEEQAKENAARAKDETELKTAEDNLRKAELEIQKAEIVSRIDAEKNQENLDEAKATYDQLRETFDLKRKAAQAAIRILEIQRDRTQQTMLHAQANADLMQIRSPLDGVVVLNTMWKQGTMGEVAGRRSDTSGRAVYAGGESGGDAGAGDGQPAGFPQPAGWADREGAAGCVSRSGVPCQARTTCSRRGGRRFFQQAAIVRGRCVD